MRHVEAPDRSRPAGLAGRALAPILALGWLGFCSPPAAAQDDPDCAPLSGSSYLPGPWGCNGPGFQTRPWRITGAPRTRPPASALEDSEWLLSVLPERCVRNADALRRALARCAAGWQWACTIPSPDLADTTACAPRVKAALEGWHAGRPVLNPEGSIEGASEP